MFYDFIEIGTSDFDTLIQSADQGTRGLSIDALSIYLDRLPSPKNCQKVQAAISDREGEVAFYFVRPEHIAQYGLASWVRGCNSIGKPHPSVVAQLEGLGLEPMEVMSVETVRMCRLMSIFDQYEVEGVYYLKVDTEGHDAVILHDFFDACDNHRLPHSLLFESNILSEREGVQRLIAKLINRGYDLIRSETEGADSNTFMRLNISRVAGREKFGGPISEYYLVDYPNDYNPLALPHENTLEAAQAYCVKHKLGGVTYQYGRFEVRQGTRLMMQKGGAQIRSWVYL